MAERNILNKWAKNDLDGDVLIEVSDSGYSNDALALAWLKHWEKHSRLARKEVYRMLIMNGYGSHLAYEFSEFARENRVL